MNSTTEVLLIGYEDNENLGLRSIMAYLLANGYTVRMLPFIPGEHEKTIEQCKKAGAKLIGFSLIFQYALKEFGALMKAMRQAGIPSHFTCGGHFPSLCPEETMEALPELDSIVRFEGELTLMELVRNVDKPEKWGEIRGLAYRRGNALVVNPNRDLIPDLDALPLIYRDEPEMNQIGVLSADILASRGCLFNCSFCSIRQFYGSVKGGLRRMRSPKHVVDEMIYLNREKGVRYFDFRDDDFAAHSKREKQWIADFLQEIEKAGLADQIRWKISCRVDDLDPVTIKSMIDHGLRGVYLGVESGSPSGLKTLNKHVTVEQNLYAVNLIKSQGIALSMGFMLFDPSSSVPSIRENIDFLRTVGSDGYFPISFCKMLPYVGTPIEKQLREANRLKGSVTEPDYDFLDPVLNHYAFLAEQIFKERNTAKDRGLIYLQGLDFQYKLGTSFGRMYPSNYGETLKKFTARYNTSMVDTLESLLELVLSYEIEDLVNHQDKIMEIAEREWNCQYEVELACKKLELSNAFKSAA
jgi:anaerobic magnesium-protoporphyrin IX monomethyl ester cyclase